MKTGLIALVLIITLTLTPALPRRADLAAQETTDITLDVKEMELTDVLRMIADQSGMNIVASKNVKGLVSISLQDIPVEKALDAILKVNNCGYVKEDGIIQVYTYPELAQKDQLQLLQTRVFPLQFVRASDLKQALLSLLSPRGKLEIEQKANSVIITDTPESIRAADETLQQMDKKQETRVYRLNYAKPAELQKSLASLIPQAEGEVLLDERTNSVIVSASPLLMQKIEALVAAWDKQVPQVLIEAKIMQITLDKNRFLGVDWQYNNGDKPSLAAGLANLPIPSGAAYVEALRYGVLGIDDYEVAVRVLERSDDAQLISSPRIVTLDNSEAKILIGSSEPYEVFHYDEQGNVDSRELKFVEVGIKLIVKPKITDDGFITLTIRPEVSSPRKGTATTDALAVDTTEAQTTMTIKDGNTVVLGGLIKDDKEERISKIPLLGDIPLIKYLFRSTYTTSTKKEIVIFITPKIIGFEKTHPAPSEEKTPRSEEMRKAIETAQ